jgi:hypothetical protein
MLEIKPPSIGRHHPDRDLECQAALRDAFAELVGQAARAGSGATRFSSMFNQPTLCGLVVQSREIILTHTAMVVGSRMRCDLRMIPMGCHSQGRRNGPYLLPYRFG